MNPDTTYQISELHLLEEKKNVLIVFGCGGVDRKMIKKKKKELGGGGSKF